MKKLCIMLSVFLALTCFSRAASADVFDTYGAGSRGMSMGSANCASVDDMESTYYNPAGLGRSYGNTARFSYLYSYPLHQMNGLAVLPPDNNDISMGMLFVDLGISVNEIVNKLPVQITLGFSMSMMQDLTLARMEDLEESLTQYIRFGGNIKRTAIYAGLGIEVIPGWVWIGGGIHAMIKGNAAVNMTISSSAISTVVPILPTSMDMWMDIKAEINPTCGIIIKPLKFIKAMEGLNIAFSYKNDIAARVNPFVANLTLTIGPSSAILKAYSAVLTYYNPDVFRYGISYEIKGFTAEFNVAMEQWEGFKRSAPRNLRRTSLPFKNILTYHGGLEYKLPIKKIMNLLFRVGYQYAPTPLPNQPFYSNYLDTNRHIVSAGIGIQAKDPFRFLNQPFSLEFAIQDQILERRSFNKLSLYTPGYSSFTLQGHNLAMMVSLRFKFGSTIPDPDKEKELEEDVDFTLKLRNGRKNK